MRSDVSDRGFMRRFALNHDHHAESRHNGAACAAPRWGFFSLFCEADMQRLTISLDDPLAEALDADVA